MLSPPAPDQNAFLQHPAGLPHPSDRPPVPCIMHRPRFALLLLCAVLAATAAPAVAGDDGNEPECACIRPNHRP